MNNLHLKITVRENSQKRHTIKYYYPSLHQKLQRTKSVQPRNIHIKSNHLKAVPLNDKKY